MWVLPTLFLYKTIVQGRAANFCSLFFLFFLILIQQIFHIYVFSFFLCLRNQYGYSPVRIQATFSSHHSGTRGRTAIILSPLCKPHASESILAVFLDRNPNSSKLHFTSSPSSFTHQKAGFAGRFPS